MTVWLSCSALAMHRDNIIVDYDSSGCLTCIISQPMSTCIII